MRFIKIFFSFLFFLITVESHALKIGDNLYTEFHKWQSVKESVRPTNSPWKEEKELLLLWSFGESAVNNTNFISTPDKKIFTAFITEGENSFYLSDLDNDSIIDTKSNDFYMPYQMIKSRSKVSGKDTTVLKLFNHFYLSTLQADNNIELDSKDVELLKTYFTDTTLVNRHLIYLFTTCQYLITNANQNKTEVPIELSIPIVKSLADECLTIYKKIPPLICIYKVESLLNDEKLKDQARQEVKTYLKMYPESIPLQVYDCYLEEDDKIKGEKLKALRKDHGDHWMVKTL